LIPSRSMSFLFIKNKLRKTKRRTHRAPMLMRKYINLILVLVLSMVALSTVAQKRTTMATLYREFRPSMITFSS